MSAALLLLLVGTSVWGFGVQAVPNINPQQIAATCGECPTGTTREISLGPYCGRCVPIGQSCANGFYWDDRNSKCDSCPCRVPEATCAKATDGHPVCRCPREYQGRYCERCSSGYVQESHYPYKCVEVQARPAVQPLPPLPQLSAGCPVPANGPSSSTALQSRVQRSTPVNGCPPCYPNPYCPPCVPGNPPPPYNCPPCVPGSPPPPYNCPPCVPGNQPIVPGGCVFPPNCPGNPPGGCPSPPNCPGNPPGGCPSPPNCPYPPGPPPNNCWPWPWPNPNCTIIPVPTPAPVICPTCPTLPPPNGRPPPECPGLQCPTIPACPTYPGCPSIPACPPNPGCPAIPGCPDIPRCPDYPPWPEIPPWPQIPACPPYPPIPPCPQCPPSQPCREISCPPPPPLVCNVTCGCCDKGPPELIRLDEPCICDPRGTVRQDGNSCICKMNVQGASCNACKPGYFALRHGNELGCSQCFCSGVTDRCKSLPMRRESSFVSMSALKLVDRDRNSHPVKYIHASGAAEFTFGSDMSQEFYWQLPEAGNLMTSYGLKIHALREYSSAVMTSVPGNDVVIEGRNGDSLFWSASEPCPPDKETEMVVRIQESDNWLIWRNDRASYASRADIMGVLANVSRILLRASFTPTRMKITSIRRIRLERGVESERAKEGFTINIEECQCPRGYQGLSCENCSPGYYRDTGDMSRSVFGNCKKCPCNQNSEGCWPDGGSVICVCKHGFTGPRCEDRDFVSVVLDPSRVRDCVGTRITFNCTYSSSRPVRVEFEFISSSFTRIETVRVSNGISTTIAISDSRPSDRLICRVLDAEPNRPIVAEVYSTIDGRDCAPPIVAPIVIGPFVRVEAQPKFICVNESQEVEFTCAAWSFASRRLRPEWSRAGTKSMPESSSMMDDLSGNRVLRIRRPVVADTGTYYCTAEDSRQLQLEAVVLLVKRKRESLLYPFIEQDDAPFDASGETFEEFGDPKKEGNVSSTTEAAPPPLEPLSPNPILFPPPVFVSVLPPELEVIAGHSAEFKCNVAGDEEELSMYWRKRDGIINQDVKANGSVLHFDSVRKVHEGEYHCVASNKLGKNSDSAYLRVVEQEPGDAPSMPSYLNEVSLLNLHATISPAHEVLRPGDKVVLACEGNEKDLRFIWSKLNDTIRSSVPAESKDGKIMFPSVIPSDSGWYICSATSSDGARADSAKVQLIVKSEEIAPTVVIAESSPLTVKIGHRVHLECQTFGEPIPVVTWSRFINTADGFEEQTLLEASTPNSIYEIRRVVKEHEGDYFCTGRNEAGQDRVSIRLEVDEGVTCNSGEFRCHSGDQCVQIEDRCDKEHDCRDGSDERHCHRRQRRASAFY